MSGWLEVSVGTEWRSVDRLPVGPSQMPLDALATMNCFDWALRRCLWMLLQPWIVLILNQKLSSQNAMHQQGLWKPAVRIHKVWRWYQDMPRFDHESHSTGLAASKVSRWIMPRHAKIQPWIPQHWSSFSRKLPQIAKRDGRLYQKCCEWKKKTGAMYINCLRGKLWEPQKRVSALEPPRHPVCSGHTSPCGASAAGALAWIGRANCSPAVPQCNTPPIGGKALTLNWG